MSGHPTHSPARTLPAVDALAREHLAVNLSHAFERIYLLRRLIVADSHDARKAQREAALVKIALRDNVKGNFEHELGLNGNLVRTRLLPPVLQRKAMVEKPRCQLGDFGVRQARVGFSYCAQATVVAAHGEGVVGENAGALAVSPLDGDDDDIEGRELALELRHQFPRRPGT